MPEKQTLKKTNHFGRLKLPKSDPHFSHLSQDAREEVFERLQKALNDMASYIPMCRQNPYWKARVVNHICVGWEGWALANGWLGDFSFPLIEDCFDSVLRELGTVAQIALLDPRLQIEVVPISSDGFPVYAFFPMHRHGWITKWIEVRPATRILLLLSKPDIETMPKEETMKVLRHHLGHSLLYLREPKAKNECPAADEEWTQCAQSDDGFIRTATETS